MRLAHVRERHAPAGSPWRLVAALVDPPSQWIDLEVARRRALAARPELAHDAPLYRQPVSTLDAHLTRGLRVAVLAELVEDFAPRGDPAEDEAILDSGQLTFGAPLLAALSLRDGYGFERHVATMWARRDSEIPEAWYRLAVFYFSNVSEMRGPDDPVWAPRGSSELDYELEIAALIDTPARDLTPERAEEAIGGYTILNDWSARDLQRDESTVRLGPAKGKDFATAIGPWLVTPDELSNARSGKGFNLEGVATVRTPNGGGVEVARTSWSTVSFSFGEMLERASSDVRIRPGELIGSGTFGGGSLLESKEGTLGRWLEPGDEVVLSIERLGVLRTSIVERSPAA
jgi:fumarylacetoacetate (FAA) hydrolase